MTLETQRLSLRPWREDDATALYEYAKDPRVGPMAGWPVHTSVENSREIIRNVLSSAETYAVVLRGETDPIGSVGLLVGQKSNLSIPPNEGEIGYWLAVPYWGQGLIPEAVREMLRRGFLELGLAQLWCCYFDNNEKSHRVQEKCGFHHQYTEENKFYLLINATKRQHVSSITRAQWDEQQHNTQE